MKNEIWKTVVGFPYYEVSNLGRVRRIRAEAGTWVGRILKPGLGKYALVRLAQDGIKTTRNIHILVAEAFLGQRPDGCQVNHKNFDRHDSRLANLEYCTAKENIGHASKNGRMARGERHGLSKLTATQVLEIRSMAEQGISQRPIAKKFGISQRHVSQIVRREIWQHLSGSDLLTEPEGEGRVG